MTPVFSTQRSSARAPLVACLLAGLLVACSATTERTPAPPASTGGTTGAPATGGSVGTSTGGTGTSTGGTGGSATSAGGTGGSNAPTGGSSGAVDASSPGTGGANGESDGGAAPASDGGPPVTGGKHPIMPGNALVKCGANNFHLPGASAEDFCAFYEMYCPYDPTGMMLNKGQTPAQRPDAHSTAPWYHRDYADCLARYNMATDTAKSCRAGQLCTNKAGGCTHATGHFADCP
jgi:hypothetical protein